MEGSPVRHALGARSSSSLADQAHVLASDARGERSIREATSPPHSGQALTVKHNQARENQRSATCPPSRLHPASLRALLSSCCQMMAEGARFELAVGCPTTVFKTVTLNHSDTP